MVLFFLRFTFVTTALDQCAHTNTNDNLQQNDKRHGYCSVGNAIDGVGSKRAGNEILGVLELGVDPAIGPAQNTGNGVVRSLLEIKQSPDRHSVEYGKAHDTNSQLNVSGSCLPHSNDADIEGRGGSNPTSVDGEGETQEPKFDQLAGAFRVVLRIQQSVEREQDEKHKNQGKWNDFIGKAEGPSDLSETNTAVPVRDTLLDHGVTTESFEELNYGKNGLEDKDDGPNAECSRLGGDDRLIFFTQVPVGSIAKPSVRANAVGENNIEDVGKQIENVLVVDFGWWFRGGGSFLRGLALSVGLVFAEPAW